MPRSLLLVAWGVFVSTLGQTATIGSLPLRTLLRDHLHCDATRVAVFFSLANLAWYFKPVAGLLSDSFPLLGTRRRHYLLFGSAASVAAWFLLGWSPLTFTGLLGAAIVLNIFLVLVSTATGGLLVEEGRRFGATGTFSSARVVTFHLAIVLSGLIGGWLAMRSLHITALVAAALILSYVPMVWLLLREPPTAQRNIGVMQETWQQIKRAVSSGGLWAAAGLLFLVHVSPGFQTALYFHMRSRLNFDPLFIGWTDSIGGVAGIVASLVYVILCRAMSLRWSYTIAILAAGLGALPFLGLHGKASALVICFVYHFGLVMADVASLDLAARATPRGVEAMGYALMISFWNIGLMGSDLSGSWMYDKHVPFPTLVYVNAGTTLLVLIAVPFLPRRLVAGTEGQMQRGFEVVDVENDGSDRRPPELRRAR